MLRERMPVLRRGIMLAQQGQGAAFAVMGGCVGQADGGADSSLVEAEEVGEAYCAAAAEGPVEVAEGAGHGPVPAAAGGAEAGGG